MQVVKVTVDNAHAYLMKYDNSTWDYLRDYWAYFSPRARFSTAYKHWLNEKRRAEERGLPITNLDGWDGRIRLLQKDGSVPAGLFRATKKELEGLGVRFKVTYKRPSTPKCEVSLPSDKEHIYQERCVDSMVKAIRRGGGIVWSATGTGKTAVAAKLFKKIPWSVLFVVDQRNLLYQTQKELEDWLGEPVGIVGDSKYEIERVTVGTVQTLSKHTRDHVFKKWFRTIKLVVVDELHVQMNRSNFKVLNAIKPVARFGLTATMQMSKKDVRMRAWSFAGPVIFKFPIAKAQSKGVVTHGRAVQLLFPEFDQQLKQTYLDAYKEDVVESGTKLDAAMSITKWLVSQGRYVIILVSRVAHVKAVADALNTAADRLAMTRSIQPFTYGVAYGKVGKQSRIDTIKDFEAGKIKIIVANVVFEKGVNIKRVDAIIDMAEMKSKNSAVQKFGRGVRLHKDKTQLWYIDIGTQTGRFGKAAKSRARALKAEAIPVDKIKVEDASQALATIKKWAVKVPKVQPGAKNVATRSLGRKAKVLK